MDSFQNNKNQIVSAYLNSFENGERFTPPSEGIVINGRLDNESVKILNSYLDTSKNAFVRENIIELLIDLGIQSNQHYDDGIENIKNKSVLDALANTGLKIPDLAREASVDALRNLVNQEDLIHYAPSIREALEESPSNELLLLVAKTKFPEAEAEIEKLVDTKSEEDNEAYKIVLAAVGDSKITNAYIDSIETAADKKDVEKFSHLLETLSLIGTKEALTKVAEYLRTPLIIDIPGAYQKSLRLNVLEALLYNYPDQWFFYPNNIIEEDDYKAAEAFCIDKFDISFDTPPPPFMTYIGYPIPLKK